MVNAAFHLAVYTAIFFLVGMYNPKWSLFFLKKPDRFLVVVISLVSVMVFMTLYGEGRHKEKLDAAELANISAHAVDKSAPVPTVPAQ